MFENNEKEDLRAYRSGPLTVLELLVVVAALSGLLAWVAHKFFMA